jgi:hypothetical protein
LPEREVVEQAKAGRLLKNSFLTEFSCKIPNDFEGHFFKTGLVQRPASS